MNVMQCNLCKRPFQSLGRRTCPECLEQMDKDFFVVRDYIYEHKQTNMDKVAEGTGVSKQVILHLLKEGRLELDDGSGGGGVLKCDMCKRTINSGRLCNNCKDKVSNTMQKSIETRSAMKKEAASNTNPNGMAKLK